jgi:hypothetical protein
MRARFYDPATAQFLSRDPLTAITGEPYAYVADNPLNTSDPSGFVGEALIGCADPTPAETVTCPIGVGVTLGEGAVWLIGIITAVVGGAVAAGPDSLPTPSALPGPSANINYAKRSNSGDEYDTGCLEQEARRADVQRRRDNRVFEEMTKDLSPGQKERLHRRISKQGYTPEEIQDEIDTLFGNRG